MRTGKLGTVPVGHLIWLVLWALPSVSNLCDLGLCSNFPRLSLICSTAGRGCQDPGPHVCTTLKGSLALRPPGQWAPGIHLPPPPMLGLPRCWGFRLRSSCLQNDSYPLSHFPSLSLALSFISTLLCPSPSSWLISFLPGVCSDTL